MCNSLCRSKVVAKVRETKNLEDARRALSSDETAAEHARCLLRSACEQGRFELLCLVKELYDLDSEDARSNHNYALRKAAENGYVGVLVALRAFFALNARDARARGNYAMRKAAENGHAEVVRVLRTEYWLGVEDARSRDDEALRFAARGGHLEVLRELGAFGLTAEDARDSGAIALLNAVDKNRASTVRFLRSEFGLRREDAKILAVRYGMTLPPRKGWEQRVLETVEDEKTKAELEVLLAPEEPSAAGSGRWLWLAAGAVGVALYRGYCGA